MPALQLDLIRAIVRHGAAVSADVTVDPSTSDELRHAGVALVTTYIEQLSLIGLIKDPSPLFGRGGGMWIGYRLTDRCRTLAQSDDELRRAVGELIGGPKTEVADAIAQLQTECSSAKINDNYRDDFLKTLDEIRICFDAGCFIAAISLCGKVLEVCLKEILRRNGVVHDSNAMIGMLLKTIKDKVPNEYVDPGLANIADLINKHRIGAIHAKERIPIPSRDQTIMVLFATRDVVRRSLSHVGT